MELQNIIHIYKLYKETLQIISDGDRLDDMAQDLRRGLKVNDVLQMKQFTTWCEDQGIHLLVRQAN